MKEEKVTILNEFREKLVGLKTVPSNRENKYSTVVLVHGFGVTKSEDGMFDNLANHLSENGFLVYRFDFSGCGESEGDYSETSLSKLKSDLSKILDFVKSQSKVDSSRIGIHAQSFGTATTIALEPAIQCLVMTGSISHPKEVMSKLFGDGYHPEGISTRTKSEGTITRIKPQFWKDFENYDLLNSIKKINCPILFIHGSKDDRVPISEMEAYFRNANEPKEKIIIEGVDHGLEPCREKMYEIAVQWFKRWLIMSGYHGNLLDTEFRDQNFLNRFKVFAKRKSKENPWTMHGVVVPADKLENTIKEVQENLLSNKPYYAHFYRDEELIIVFKEKIFRITPDKSTWEEAIEYGHSLGILDKQLVFAPNRFEDEEEYYGKENFL